MLNQKNISTISDLRFKTKAVLKKAESSPVFLFKRSTPWGVFLSYDMYQQLMDTLEDFYLSTKAESYEEEDKKKIDWIPHSQVKKLLNV